MKIVAGIDGGGTGTTLELRRTDSSFLERKSFGPFNVNSIGRERALALLLEIFQYIQERGECIAVCVGAAGISNTETTCIIETAANMSGMKGRLLLKGDQEIALYGACAGSQGAILIAGTGSICMGMDQEGRICRVGGLGHLIDDEGSGYALGREGLRAVARSLDGRSEPAILTDLIMENWKISGREELIGLVYGAPDKSRVASLAPLVEQAARMGDGTAWSIIEKGAASLLELVLTVKHQLSLEHMDLSLMGGLLRSDTLIKEQLLAGLTKSASGVEVRPPMADAAQGAAMLAVMEGTHG